MARGASVEEGIREAQGPGVEQTSYGLFSDLVDIARSV